jgi:hypothetical protein
VVSAVRPRRAVSGLLKADRVAVLVAEPAAGIAAANVVVATKDVGWAAFAGGLVGGRLALVVCAL